MEDKRFSTIRSTIERYPDNLHLILGAATCPEDLVSNKKISFLSSEADIKNHQSEERIFVWDMTGKLQGSDEVLKDPQILLVPIPENSPDPEIKGLDDFAKLLGL